MRTYFFLLFFTTLSCQSQELKFKNDTVPLSKLIKEYGINSLYVHSIVIDKSDYTLSVYIGYKLLKQYPVVFGGNPVDDKLRQGDNCTPEGIFQMRSKYPHKNWSKFVWINYPTADSWKKHREAKNKGLIPANAAIGGEVGIHGVPEGMDRAIDEKINWTLGCISLKNKDINELYPYITAKTSIKIIK